MTALHSIFYFFSTVAVLSGLMVVSSKNPVHSVLFLVLTFFSMASVWVLLHAEFLALILVLVYVGAVMTLFLFVVMMLNIRLVSHKKSFVRYFPVAALVVLLIVGFIVMVVWSGRFGLSSVTSLISFPADYSNTADLGSVLYTDYAYPFEVAGVLLLTAIIAAISLTHRKPKDRLAQNVRDQIAVRREDRVQLIDLPSEKKGRQ